MIELNEFFYMIAVLMLFTAFWAQVGSYVISKIQVIVVQTSLLTIYTFISGIYALSLDLIVLAFLIIFLRGILTAYILLRKFPERRQLTREKSTTMPSILIISVAVLVFTLIVYQLVIYPIILSLGASVTSGVKAPVIAIAFIMVIQGLLLVATRKNKVTQLTGYIEVENAMILMSLGIFPLPIVVELSILLDVLALVIVASVLLSGSMSSESLPELIG
jgi:Hydrogenase 4 membrane component (E)